MKRLVAGVIVGLVIGVAPVAGIAAGSRAPRSCLRALTRAETVMRLSAEGFAVVGQMFEAAARFDLAAIEAGTAQLNANVPIVRAQRDAYDRAAARCRQT